MNSTPFWSGRRLESACVAAVVALVSLPGAAPPSAPSCLRAAVELTADLDTARARAGDPFAVRTAADAVAPDGTILPAQTPGYGIVAIAQHAERGGRGGYLVLEVRYLVTPAGAHVPATIDWAGAARATATGASQNIPGIVGAVPLVGYVLGPYAFLHHGRDVTLPRGTRLTVILGDDEAAGACRVVPAPSASPQPSASPTA